MRLSFIQDAWEDYLYWQQTDPRIVVRINELLNDTLRHPFSGLGKPEPLKGDYRGFWSRRISQEHRLVYCVNGKGDDQTLVIAQCRFHYK
jgi:toxin YoeB